MNRKLPERVGLGDSDPIDVEQTDGSVILRMTGPDVVVTPIGGTLGHHNGAMGKP